MQEPLQLCKWLSAYAVSLMKSLAGLTLLYHDVAALCQQY